MRTENQPHILKNQRHLKEEMGYPIAVKPAETPNVLVDLRERLAAIYGTWKGPKPRRLTHKEAYEARVAKRMAKQEVSIDTIESLDTTDMFVGKLRTKS